LYSNWQELLACKKNNLEFIPGVEIQGMGSEILGYFFNEKDESLLSFLEKQKKQTVKYTKKKIQGLEELNIDISYEEVSKIAKSKYVSPTHIAELMMDKHIIESIQEAYDKYFKYISVRLETPPPKLKKIIKLITDSGGVAVLPHPWYIKKNYTDFESILIKLVDYGLKGIETIGYIPEELKIYKNKDRITEIIKMADRYDLIKSGGSDFHGLKIHPNNKLGEYYVSKKIVDDLRNLANNK
jgi:predicted metal-dependent phosphoesterase TrpH